MGLEAVFLLGRRRIRVQTDSQLLVRQLKVSIESKNKSASGFLNGL
jgi:ribonuclease HI